jgi:hypothetical protein
VVVVGRSWVVLTGDEGVEGGLLLGAAAQDQDQVRECKIGTSAAEVRFGTGHWKDIAGERDEAIVIDLLRDTRQLRSRR